jgi:hypothetical protein
VAVPSGEQFDTEGICDFGRAQWSHLNQRRPPRCEREAEYVPQCTGHTLLVWGAGASSCLSLVSVFWSSSPSVGEITGCPSGECSTLTVSSSESQNDMIIRSMELT